VPKVSFIIVVRNEEAYIKEKIDNAINLDYPKELLEIIIGSDGSTDHTSEIINSLSTEGIKVYISEKHIGKVNVLNKIVPQASGDIIVFSDARQKFEKSALRELSANFNDPDVGCVSGELVLIGKNESPVGEGVGLYWDYEKFLRKKESQIYSMLGATGAIYAIRKKLFMPPPYNTILDDVYIPLKIVEQGYRAIFDSTARAYDKVSSSSANEFKRKVRTLAGNFELFLLCINMFNPLRSKVAWQFFSHKFLRAIAFFFLTSFFTANFFLKDIYPYYIAFILQLVFYSLAIVGMLVDRMSKKNKIFSFPYTFCMLNLAALVGFLKFFSGRQKITWKE